MTDPSEMTDLELKLAIAEIIAKQNGWELVTAKPGGSDHWLTEAGIKFVPDYLGDPAAALGLAEDYAYTIYSPGSFTDEGLGGDSKEYSVTLYRKGLPSSSYGGKCGRDWWSANGKTLARAISEASYMALIAKRS